MSELHWFYEVSRAFMIVASTACLAMLSVQAYWDRSSLYDLFVNRAYSKFVVHRSARVFGIIYAFLWIASVVDYYGVHNLYGLYVRLILRSATLSICVAVNFAWLFFTLKPLYPFLFINTPNATRYIKMVLFSQYVALFAFYTIFLFSTNNVVVIVCSAYYMVLVTVIWAMNITLSFRMGRLLASGSPKNSHLHEIVASWRRSARWQSIAMAVPWLLFAYYVGQAVLFIYTTTPTLAEREVVDPTSVPIRLAVQNFAFLYFLVFLLRVSWRSKEVLLAGGNTHVTRSTGAKRARYSGTASSGGFLRSKSTSTSGGRDHSTSTSGTALSASDACAKRHSSHYSPFVSPKDTAATAAAGGGGGAAADKMSTLNSHRHVNTSPFKSAQRNSTTLPHSFSTQPPPLSDSGGATSPFNSNAALPAVAAIPHSFSSSQQSPLSDASSSAASTMKRYRASIPLPGMASAFTTKNLVSALTSTNAPHGFRSSITLPVQLHSTSTPFSARPKHPERPAAAASASANGPRHSHSKTTMTGPSTLPLPIASTTQRRDSTSVQFNPSQKRNSLKSTPVEVVHRYSPAPPPAAFDATANKREAAQLPRRPSFVAPPVPKRRESLKPSLDHAQGSRPHLPPAPLDMQIANRPSLSYSLSSPMLLDRAAHSHLTESASASPFMSSGIAANTALTRSSSVLGPQRPTATVTAYVTKSYSLQATDSHQESIDVQTTKRHSFSQGRSPMLSVSRRNSLKPTHARSSRLQPVDMQMASSRPSLSHSRSSPMLLDGGASHNHSHSTISPLASDMYCNSAVQQSFMESLRPTMSLPRRASLKPTHSRSSRLQSVDMQCCV